ncbi:MULTISPECIES: hypothetical protein [unclassified Sphingomonas]|uniref:hypothetical protein n=1 Tax=unclassified Sphingomonas TaxID=196159 RepID=UPI0021512EF0|nr:MULTISPECIES: hypothetical protein [unclassified Sphingomonas]MCR5870688.1 hypothetical protein [Sphingomonas sp. J344]UUY00976.1 hypothetical protein LRS08_07950 [Sphingomonas sp. J315]
MTLLFMPLAFGLSACVTASTTLYAQPCFTQMAEASGLTKKTPHAPLPRTDRAGDWVDFANRESGQVDEANARADGLVGIGRACDAREAEAKKKLERKRFLGVF